MDPETCLAEMRELAARLVNSRDETTLDLVMHFFALDQWLTEGGFVPKDWKPE